MCRGPASDADPLSVERGSPAPVPDPRQDAAHQPTRRADAGRGSAPGRDAGVGVRRLRRRVLPRRSRAPRALGVHRGDAQRARRGGAAPPHHPTAALRLEIEDWYARHPEIDDEPVVAPLIGLGLPRTGSTALSCLLAEDPRARSLRLWESGQPWPPPSTVDPPDPRIATTEANMAIQNEMNPRLAALVPSSPTGPMECQELMALDFRAHYFPAFAHLPSYTEWLLDADLTSTYRYERRALKLLQWGEPTPRPWRLKCPSHLLWLDALDTVFPDAAVRDDPPRPDRRDGVGGRRLPGGRPAVQRRPRPPVPRAPQRRPVGHGDGPPARVPRRRARRPVLRHRLPHHAGRPDRRGAPALRLAR